MTEGGIQYAVDVPEDGVLLVDLLVSTSGLTKSAVKDAVLKGAVWIERIIKSSAKDSGFETNEKSKLTADKEGMSSLADAVLNTDNKGVAPNKVDKQRYKKPRRLRRVKAALVKSDRILFNYDPSVLRLSSLAAVLIADEGSYSVWFKPAGMLCQGSKWSDHTTVYRWAESVLQPQRQAFIIHRLDKMTSGIIVLGHSKAATVELARQFADRETEKLYRVIVRGEFNLPLPYLIDATLDDKVATTIVLSSRPANQLLASFEEAIDGNSSRPLKSLASLVLPGDDILPLACSELELKIETGRKHQIRKHLSGIGFGVLGDRMYDASAVESGGELNKGATQKLNIDLQLQAVGLSFSDPQSGEVKRYYL